MKSCLVLEVCSVIQTAVSVVLERDDPLSIHSTLKAYGVQVPGTSLYVAAHTVVVVLMWAYKVFKDSIRGEREPRSR